MFNENPEQQDSTTMAILCFLIIGFLLALTMFGASKAHAQTRLWSQDPVELCYSGVSTNPRYNVCNQVWYSRHQDEMYKLQYAILTSLTMRFNAEGEPVYAPSCSRASNGCETRIKTLVEIITHEAAVAKVDPWLVAGMVWHESRFNPFAESSVGTRGIMQLHPRNARFSSNRFLHRDAYRNRCRRIEGNCQEEVVQDGVSLLKDAIERCEGDFIQGLVMYNTGRCNVPTNRYTSHVLNYRAEFLELIQETM